MTLKRTAQSVRALRVRDTLCWTPLAVTDLTPELLYTALEFCHSAGLHRPPPISSESDRKPRRSSLSYVFVNNPMPAGPVED
jgi:hypothetical protein